MTSVITNVKQLSTEHCPCGQKRPYADCCGRFIEGRSLPESAEQLMRSRYTAYTRGEEAYLLATWHASTRPARLDLAQEAATKWLGLEVRRHATQDSERATVEFVARHKVAGRTFRLHETSRFVREAGHWFYVDGELK